jgi:hypothetical protein
VSAENNPSDVPSREMGGYWLQRVAEIVKAAEADGFIITVERKPLLPLAMRNHVARIQVYPKR